MQSDELRHEVAEVAAEDALAAAVERAARTQHALILAEAQILTWKRRYAEAVARAERAEVEAGDAEAEVRFLQAEVKRRGVEHGETEGAGGGSAVQRAADPAGEVRS